MARQGCQGGCTLLMISTPQNDILNDWVFIGLTAVLNKFRFLHIVYDPVRSADSSTLSHYLENLEISIVIISRDSLRPH